jgi:hypothetical protein
VGPAQGAGMGCSHTEEGKVMEYEDVRSIVVSETSQVAFLVIVLAVAGWFAFQAKIDRLEARLSNIEHVVQSDVAKR